MAEQRKRKLRKGTVALMVIVAMIVGAFGASILCRYYAKEDIPGSNQDAVVESEATETPTPTPEPVVTNASPCSW